MRTDTTRFPRTGATCRGLLVSAILLLGLPAASANPVARADTLWSENWEGDFTDNWFVDAGTWEVGAPASGPGSAYEGGNVAATVLAGNYSDSAPDSRLIRFNSFIVPTGSENPRLRFWHYFSFGGGDFGRVEISTDEGGTWETISPTYAGNSSGVWSYPLIDLTAYAGQDVQVAFFFHSQDTDPFPSTNPGPGWYVDEVAVLTGPIEFHTFEGWETGIGDWSVETGSWEVGTPTSGPGSAHNGEQTAATNLSGSYSDSASDSRLVSPRFTVSSEFGTPALRFWHWFSFGGGDFGQVQIKEVGGEWVNLEDPFSGNSSGVWSFFNVFLSDYVDQDVQIGFLFHSQDTDPFPSTNPGPGWFIDDIEVEGVVTTATEPEGRTGALTLHGASPNPTRSSTAIHIELAESADVTLHVFDVLGREVSEPVTRALAAGEHRIPWDATRLSGGVYVYRVEAQMAGRMEARSGRLTVLD